MKFLTGVLAGMLAAMPGVCATVVVSSHDDISRAGGNNSGSDGNTPVAAATFAANGGQTLMINSALGSWTCDGATSTGPDGTNCFTTGMHVGSVGVISSIDVTDFNSALFGVFLEAALPGSAPAGLRFYRSNSGSGGIQDNFTTFSPVIGQIFFVGDGLTGTGSGTQQVFNIPSTATRLYLGFADAPAYNGNPGAFSDNAGSMTVDFAISGAPEPGTWALLFSGVAGLVLARRRRR